MRSLYAKACRLVHLVVQRAACYAAHVLFVIHEVAETRLSSILQRCVCGDIGEITSEDRCPKPSNKTLVAGVLLYEPVPSPITLAVWNAHFDNIASIDLCTSTEHMQNDSQTR